MEEQNSYNLDWAQINFALQPHRLLVIDRPSGWYEFHSVNQRNMDKYYEYTPHQLCERFLNRVLTQIHNYELDDKEKHIINLLELHPNFKKTNDGFAPSRELEKIDFSRGANEGADVAQMGQEPFRNSPEGVLMNNSDLNYQIVFTPNETDSHSEQRSKHQLSEENAALLSVVLNTDEDLMFERLPESEMLKRLRKAKRLFEQRGLQMKNVNISIDELLEKLKKLCELKEVVISLVKENF